MLMMNCALIPTINLIPADLEKQFVILREDLYKERTK